MHYEAEGRIETGSADHLMGSWQIGRIVLGDICCSNATSSGIKTRGDME